MSSKYLFKAKTVRGYTTKALSEVLQNILTDVCFTLDKNGIRLLTVDNMEPSTLMVELDLKGNEFDEYYCPKPQSIGVNLQHLYKMLKSIKKKDSVCLFIEKAKPAVLGITTIQADSGQPVNSAIKIQKLSQIVASIPTGYGHPIHISTTTYQKTCKDMQNISNVMIIRSRGRFMEFDCDMEGMYGRKVPFGDTEDAENKELEEYSDTFYTKSLGRLMKVSGLNDRMRVYTPPIDNPMDVPLKISINTDQLGILNIFMKSIRQINEG